LGEVTTPPQKTFGKAHFAIGSITERAVAAGNARAHAKIIPVLRVTPLEVMLENMQWAVTEADKLERQIVIDSTPEIKLAALKELARMRDHRAELCCAGGVLRTS
jgi:hypothetical protein